MKRIKKFIKSAAFIFLISGIFPTASMCAQIEKKIEGKLIIFHAGSLTVPFVKMEKIFEAKYPKVDILREAGGSTKMARMISELQRPADIMASADFKIINNALMPEYASWNIRFATNQMVLCYTNKSSFSDEINADNWYKILNKKSVVWGHADPNIDPCGYRSLMVLQLAEKYYNLPGLYERLTANRPKKNIRPKSVELVSLLKTGNMDYAWEYLSVAVQHKLNYIILPADINLGSYKKDNFYSKASVKVTGKKPGTWINRNGKSCTYGITMIKGCPNPEAAEAFIEYLIDPDGGLKILKAMGQPAIIPCLILDKKMKKLLPASLQNRVEAE